MSGFLRIEDVASDGVRLELTAYDHSEAMVNFRPPASATRIECVLEQGDLDIAQPLIRDVDWLLAESGEATFRIHPSLDSLVRADIRRILGGRYSNRSEGEVLRVRKLRSRRDPGSMDPWTIAVISGGGNDPRIKRLIDSVERERDGREVEVLIVGPRPAMPLPEYCRVIPFQEHPVDPRFEICRKKNLAAREARHEKLLLVHDRFRLARGWFSGVAHLRPDWDVLLFPVVREGTSLRLADWNASLPWTTTPSCERYFEHYPFSPASLAHFNLPYRSYSRDLIVNGGAFAVKRELLRTIPIPEHLHWGEIEDGDWSCRLRISGHLPSFSTSACLESLADGSHAAIPELRPAVAATVTRVRSQIRSGLFRVVDSLRGRPAEDFFRRKGFFSRSMRTLDIGRLEGLPKIDWSTTSGVHLRGELTDIQNLRWPLLQLAAAIPVGKDVVLEVDTRGRSFYRRPGHSRCSESIAYETACTWKEEFALRHLITLQNHAALFWFQRTAAPERKLEKIAVFSRANVPAALAFAQKLGASAKVLPGHADGLDDADALLIAGRPQDLANPSAWKSTYSSFGQARGAQETLLLNDNVLLSRYLAAPILRLCWPSCAEGVAEDFERACILEGLWPPPVEGARR